MSKIYVPIEYTNVREAIPPGEDIIYSTIMRAFFVGGNKKYRFKSHVLMTPNGFAWTNPIRTKKREPPKIEYYNWTKVKKVKGIGFFISPIDVFALERLDGYETKINYKKRALEFGAFILPIMIDYAKRRREEMANDPSIKDRKKRKMEIYKRKLELLLPKFQKKAEKAQQKYGE